MPGALAAAPGAGIRPTAAEPEPRGAEASTARAPARPQAGSSSVRLSGHRKRPRSRHRAGLEASVLSGSGAGAGFAAFFGRCLLDCWLLRRSLLRRSLLRRRLLRRRFLRRRLLLRRFFATLSSATAFFLAAGFFALLSSAPPSSSPQASSLPLSSALPSSSPQASSPPLSSPLPSSSPPPSSPQLSSPLVSSLQVSSLSLPSEPPFRVKAYCTSTHDTRRVSSTLPAPTAAGHMTRPRLLDDTAVLKRHRSAGQGQQNRAYNLFPSREGKLFRSVPAERTTRLILDDARFEKVPLLLEIDHLAHPRERIDRAREKWIEADLHAAAVGDEA